MKVCSSVAAHWSSHMIYSGDYSQRSVAEYNEMYLVAAGNYIIDLKDQTEYIKQRVKLTVDMSNSP